MAQSRVAGLRSNVCRVVIRGVGVDTTPSHNKSTYSASFGVWLDFEMLTYAEYAPLSQSSTSLKIDYYL